jgi:uroporphyrinogen decarboxylase
MTMTGKERFLAACNNQPVDRPPVWIMRQAGRYLPEYRELRREHRFVDFCRQAELAREVALQPLRRFPLDAAILFSDILVIPEAMGISVDYRDGGPVLEPKIESPEEVERLLVPDVTRDLKYVADALDAIRDGIGPDLALLGFAGAPYTLASYIVAGGGGKRISAVKLLAMTNPEMLDTLLTRLTDVVIDYLHMQLAHGADAVQLFDTWAGELSPHAYARFEAPHVARIVAAMKAAGAPLIYYINGSAGLLDEIAKLNLDVFGVDWRQSLASVRAKLGPDVALQGNLDPLELYAPETAVRSRAREMAIELGGRGHIINLGHGIYPDTPIEGLAAFVDEITQM